MSNYQTISPEVARLICGSVDDLKCYLRDFSDEALIERCIEHCRRGRDQKTKLVMLERHLRRLRAEIGKENP